jgi:hypothetical protein
MEYFMWKITILRQKIIFFPILGGGGRTRRPLDPPLTGYWMDLYHIPNFVDSKIKNFHKRYFPYCGQNGTRSMQKQP